MSASMFLSIVIPAYNEEHRLTPTLERYTAHFNRVYGERVEFIVVVNGSTDRTAAIATEFAGRDPQVRVIVEPGKIGKGGAILLGFRAARGELVGFVDADGATPPDAFDALVEHIGEADVIIASRWIPGSIVDPPQPLSRRMASRIFNGLVRLLFGVPIRDTQCGAKLIKGDILRRVLPDLGVTRWAFDVDLLFKLRRAGGRITEHPTVWRDVAGSKLNVVRASLEMFLAISRLRLLYSPFRWVVSLYDATIGAVVVFYQDMLKD